LSILVTALDSINFNQTSMHNFMYWLTIVLHLLTVIVYDIIIIFIFALLILISEISIKIIIYSLEPECIAYGYILIRDFIQT